MWDLPGPGLEPVRPALAGRFLTTAPPEKSYPKVLTLLVCGRAWAWAFFKNSSGDYNVQLRLKATSRQKLWSIFQYHETVNGMQDFCSINDLLPAIQEKKK